MNIIWYGQNCFKIQGKDIVLVTDPFDKSIGLRPFYGSADIVTVSNNHSDHNNYSVIKNDPFVIDSAGEFEVKKVVIKGINSNYDNQDGKEKDDNVIYTIEMNEIRICHLGDLKQNALLNEQLEKIGQVDILFIPIGGVSAIDWKTANTIISQIEPRVIIPMRYKISGAKGASLKLDSVDNFCKDRGVSPKDTLEKFSVKKKDLPQDESKVVIMKVA
ncbi:MAG: MBL fold metallo-hydrolase [Patescibacteria group bacterium]|nr:MBL fold metallo-hydrolase [Patescibacteria group bacterium]